MAFSNQILVTDMHCFVHVKKQRIMKIQQKEENEPLQQKQQVKKKISTQVSVKFDSIGLSPVHTAYSGASLRFWIILVGNGILAFLATLLAYRVSFFFLVVVCIPPE